MDAERQTKSLKVQVEDLSKSFEVGEGWEQWFDWPHYITLHHVTSRTTITFD